MFLPVLSQHTSSLNISAVVVIYLFRAAQCVKVSTLLKISYLNTKHTILS